MDGIDFRRKFDDAVAEKGTLGSPVMVYRIKDGKLFNIQRVTVETHDDGSHTIWLEVDEY